jgi:4-diphosphocytidyl-2-C-methyl-D-erythritol kinase
MQTISLADELTVELTDSEGEIELKVDGPCAADAPPNEGNLAVRAARAILAARKSTAGVRIRLTKNIPAQAGLGGGSSDAAAVIKAVNKLLGKPLQKSDLAPIAVSLGADVPFFLYGGTCLVRGIGQFVDPALEYPFRFVLVKPPVGVSTSAAYRAIDEIRAGWPADHVPTYGAKFRNDFEAVVYPNYPEIDNARAALIDAGCVTTLLCGSGSAVFGLPVNDEDLDAIARRVEAAQVGQVWTLHTVPDECG